MTGANGVTAVLVLLPAFTVPQLARREAWPGRMPKPQARTAVHLQGADDIADVGRGSLEPGGQLVLTLKKGAQSATKSDVADLAARRQRIENLLTAPR